MYGCIESKNILLSDTPEMTLHKSTNSTTPPILYIEINNTGNFIYSNIQMLMLLWSIVLDSIKSYVHCHKGYKDRQKKHKTISVFDRTQIRRNEKKNAPEKL